jgi:hypothetical protein
MLKRGFSDFTHSDEKNVLFQVLIWVAERFITDKYYRTQEIVYLVNVASNL